MPGLPKPNTLVNKLQNNVNGNQNYILKFGKKRNPWINTTLNGYRIYFVYVL